MHVDDWRTSPWALTPPYDAKDSRLFRQPGEPFNAARHRVIAMKVAAMLEPLDGVPVSAYERDVLSWVGCCETHTIAVLAALLRRARQAPPAYELQPRTATSSTEKDLG